jgi:DNA-binding protein HU-beta
MTKAGLIKNMAEDAGISRAAARDALESLIKNITESLSEKDGKVTLVGFGTFRKTRLKAREGRNPQTGETIKIKARNVIRFKAGKKLKEAV